MAAKTYRIGLAGLSHGHIGAHMRAWKALPNAQIVGYAETDPELLHTYASDLSSVQHYDTVEHLLDRAKPDVISICNDTLGHASVVEAAASRGIHSVIEKPMAVVLREGEKMLVSATKHGVQVAVNWPTHIGRMGLLPALQLVRDGAVGRLYEVRHRGGSTKPMHKEADAFFRWLYQPTINGGGAFADYCGYGIDMAVAALGMPSSVFCIAGRYVREDILGDDNARMILQYPRALAMVEATWTQVGIPHGATAFYGDTGTIELRPEGIWLATSANERGKIVENLPQHGLGASLMEHLLTQLDKGEPVNELMGVRRGRDIAEVYEAGMRSVHGGRSISLPLPVVP